VSAPIRLSPAQLGQLRALRRDLHACPEVSGQEARTSARIRDFLSACNPAEFLDGLGGGHGLAAVFPGPDVAGGPTVVLRAELDALPIQETGTTAHRSTCDGVAHLCGHDGHLAALCGAGLALGAVPPRHGRVVLLAQPAEETGEGARAIADDPRYRALAPDWIFALHNLPGHPLGEVLVREGPFTAGSVGLVAKLHGRTSHAAYPEHGASPARALTDLVTGLVTLPIAIEARGELALVTVVHARLGEPSFGTSPGTAEVMATLRAAREPVLAELREAAAAQVQALAARDGLTAELAWVQEFPPVVNDACAARLAAQAARRAGLAVAAPTENPFRWSEDFGWFLRQIPGALVGIGAGLKQPELHASDYDFPDELLAKAVDFWSAIVMAVADGPAATLF
jgi:amidohydrolase